MRVPVSLHPPNVCCISSLSLLFFFYYGHLLAKWYLIMFLICLSLMTGDCEHLFLCYWCSLIFIILALNIFVGWVPIVWPGLGYGPSAEVTHTPSSGEGRPQTWWLQRGKKRGYREVCTMHTEALEEEGGEKWRLSGVCQQTGKIGDIPVTWESMEPWV